MHHLNLTTYMKRYHTRRIYSKPNGMMLTNIIASIEGEESKFIQYEYATYRAVFDDVKIFMVANKDRTDRQNLILVGIREILK
ncbi:MAG: hypothetical protein V8R51_08440 [Clostridia bacterium]